MAGQTALGWLPRGPFLPWPTERRDAQVPGGAHPSYAHGYYRRDNAAYIEWDPIAADRDRFLAWMEANVLNVGPDVFADRAAGK